MSRALRRSTATFPRAVGEVGRWAMDVAVDRTLLPAVWWQWWNNSVQRRLSSWRCGGAMWDLWFLCQTLLRYSPSPHCLTIVGLQQADRERLGGVNEGLSPRDRKHTTYTRRESMLLTHQRSTPSTSNYDQNYKGFKGNCAIKVWLITLKDLLLTSVVMLKAQVAHSAGFLIHHRVRSGAKVILEHDIWRKHPSRVKIHLQWRFSPAADEVTSSLALHEEREKIYSTS